MEKFINILHDILKSDSNEIELIKRFQEEIWDINDEAEQGSVLDILRDLAYDLDFYYSDLFIDQLKNEIRLSLEKIEKLKSN